MAAPLVLNEGAVPASARLFFRSRTNGRLRPYLFGEAFHQSERFIVGDGRLFLMAGLLLRGRTCRSARALADGHHESILRRRQIVSGLVEGLCFEWLVVEDVVLELQVQQEGLVDPVFCQPIPAPQIEHGVDGEFSFDLIQNCFSVRGVRDEENVDGAEDFSCEFVDLEDENELDVTGGRPAGISLLLDLLQFDPAVERVDGRLVVGAGNVGGGHARSCERHHGSQRYENLHRGPPERFLGLEKASL